jgi:hypothetical protein
MKAATALLCAVLVALVFSRPRTSDEVEAARVVTVIVALHVAMSALGRAKVLQTES